MTCNWDLAKLIETLPTYLTGQAKRAFDSLTEDDKRTKETLFQTIRDKIDPHVITNESVIEHTFGTQTRRGQGNNQPMKDYIEIKRLNAVDFQIRMCKTPFNQKCLSKVFNKSYQDLDERYLKISFDSMTD